MSRNVFEKFRSLLYSILSLFLLVFLASCYPEFKNPIPPPPELKADHQILGTWVRTLKADQYEYKEQLYIFPRGSGWIDVVWIYDIDREEPADGINVLVFEGYSTSVNKQKFLCLRFREKDFNWAFQKPYSRSDKEIGGVPFAAYWIIVNYETSSKGDLVIKCFSIPKVEELIKKGKLKGGIVKEDASKATVFENATFNGQRFEDLLKARGLSPIEVITSSSDELVDVISREGVGAFIWQDGDDVLRDIYILVFSRIKP